MITHVCCEKLGSDATTGEGGGVRLRVEVGGCVTLELWVQSSTTCCSRILVGQRENESARVHVVSTSEARQRTVQTPQKKIRMYFITFKSARALLSVPAADAEVKNSFNPKARTARTRQMASGTLHDTSRCLDAAAAVSVHLVPVRGSFGC